MIPTFGISLGLGPKNELWHWRYEIPLTDMYNQVCLEWCQGKLFKMAFQY